jgi:hypothetical protein
MISFSLLEEGSSDGSKDSRICKTVELSWIRQHYHEIEALSHEEYLL